MKNKFFFAFLLIGLVFVVTAVFHMKPSITILPVVINSLRSPLLMVVIEGKQHHIEFDSGAQIQLQLKQKIIHSFMQKKPYGFKRSFDIRGNMYEHPSFHVPYIQLENITLKDVEVVELDEKLEYNTCLAGNRHNIPSTQGILGLDVFRNKNILFDFAHSSLIVCDDKSTLEKRGYHFASMLQVPFVRYGNCICITIETDMGPLKFAIDTGASITMVRAALFQEQVCQFDPIGLPKFTTSTFVLNGKDFGSQDIFLLDLTPKLSEIDGLLGMDFLLKHQLYIDQQTNVISIV